MNSDAVKCLGRPRETSAFDIQQIITQALRLTTNHKWVIMSKTRAQADLAWKHLKIAAHKNQAKIREQKKEIILVLIAILISDRVTCKMEQLISSIYLDVLTIGVMLSIGLVIKNNLLFFNF